jgi:hypothetical protein
MTSPSSDQFVNNIITTIAGGAGGAGTSLLSTDLTLILATGTGVLFPNTANGPFYLLLGTLVGTWEVVKVTARVTDTCTIVRASSLTGPDHGTSSTFAVGTIVQQTVSAGALADIWSRIQAYPYNVRDFLATGNGVTDDTTAITNCIAAANAAGGGCVYFPAGTYIISAALTLYANVQLEGDGPGTTIIKLKNASNVDMFKSNNFATLTGTNNNAAGISSFSISLMTIDGNRANQTTAGYGVRIYGFNYFMRDVVVRNCFNDGIYSEWATTLPGSLGDSVEAHLINVKSHDNGNHGIEWAGPLNSTWDNIETFNNSQATTHTYSGMFVRQSATVQGGILQILNCASYGTTQQYALNTQAQIMLQNNRWQDAFSAQILFGGSGASFSASNSQEIADYITAGGAATPVGIQIGQASIPVGGLTARGVVIGSCTSGAVNLVDDGGSNVIDLFIGQASGTVIAGAQSSTTYFSYYLAGGVAGNSQLQTTLLQAQTPVNLRPTFQETGYCGVLAYSSASGQFLGQGVNLKTVLTNVLTSVTLSMIASGGVTAESAQDFSRYGFEFFVTTNVTGGYSSWFGTYTTVGNCLLSVDAVAQTVSHHCEGCGDVHTLPFAQIRQSAPLGTTTPGRFGLSVICPKCGVIECFNTALTDVDAQDLFPQGSGQYATTRGAVATLIRQLQQALNLPVATAAVGTTGTTATQA